MLARPSSKATALCLGAAALLALAHSTGCGQVLGIGDLVFDLPNAGGAGGMGAGGHGGTGPSSGGAGGTSTTSTGGSGGMAMLPDGPQLELLGGGDPPDRYGIQVADSFRLEFFEDTGWQLKGWFDLASDPTLDLASFLPGVGFQQTDALFNGFIYQFNGTWYQVDDALTEGITVIDQQPARVIMDTTMTLPLASAGMQVDVRYTVYPSGRVAVHSVATNLDNQSQSLQDSEFNYTSVNHALNWEPLISANSLAAGWRRQDGMPSATMAIISHGSEVSLAQDAQTNFYWQSGMMTLSAGGTFSRDGELQFALSGIGDAGLAARADDVLNPGVLSIMGGSDMGYDTASGAYMLSADDGSTDISFLVNGTLIRFQPAFVVEQFAARDWTLHLGDELLATSNDISGPKTHVFQDMDNQLLIIAYLDSIDHQLPNADRTFRLQLQ